MASKIYYKMASQDVGPIGEVAFTGQAIRFLDLKREIMNQLFSGDVSKAEFDLEVKDAEKGTTFDETSLIPRNSRVIVSRTSIVNPRYFRRQIAQSHLNEEMQPGTFERQASLDDFQDPLKTQASTSTQQFNGTDTIRDREVNEGAPTQKASGGAPAGKGFNRFVSRMDMAGNVKPKKTTGIPKNLLAASNETQGLQVVADDSAFDRKVKTQGNLGMSLEEVEARIAATPSIVVPDELMCRLTRTLLRDAVILPCCLQPCSLEKINDALISSGLICPLCGQSGISPDMLKADKTLRDKVTAFINEVRQQLEKTQEASVESSSKTDDDNARTTTGDANTGQDSNLDEIDLDQRRSPENFSTEPATTAPSKWTRRTEAPATVAAPVSSTESSYIPPYQQWRGPPGPVPAWRGPPMYGQGPPSFPPQHWGPPRAGPGFFGPRPPWNPRNGPAWQQPPDSRGPRPFPPPGLPNGPNGSAQERSSMPSMPSGSSEPPRDSFEAEVSGRADKRRSEPRPDAEMDRERRPEVNRGRQPDMDRERRSEVDRERRRSVDERKEPNRLGSRGRSQSIDTRRNPSDRDRVRHVPGERRFDKGREEDRNVRARSPDRAKGRGVQRNRSPPPKRSRRRSPGREPRLEPGRGRRYSSNDPERGADRFPDARNARKEDGKYIDDNNSHRKHSNDHEESTRSDSAKLVSNPRPDDRRRERTRDDEKKDRSKRPKSRQRSRSRDSWRRQQTDDRSSKSAKESGKQKSSSEDARKTDKGDSAVPSQESEPATERPKYDEKQRAIEQRRLEEEQRREQRRARFGDQLINDAASRLDPKGSSSAAASKSSKRDVKESDDESSVGDKDSGKKERKRRRKDKKKRK